MAKTSAALQHYKGLAQGQVFTAGDGKQFEESGTVQRSIDKEGRLTDSHSFGVVRDEPDETSRMFEMTMPPLRALDGILWPEEPTNDENKQRSGGEEGPWHPMFHLHTQLGRGAQGDVWQAVRLDGNGQPDLSTAYVLKRLFSNKAAALLSGVREAYFGSRLRQLAAGDDAPHAALQHVVARFETHFERLLETDRSSQASFSQNMGQPGPEAPPKTPSGPDTGELLRTAVRLYEAAQATTASDDPKQKHLPAVLRMLLPPPPPIFKAGAALPQPVLEVQREHTQAVQHAGLLPTTYHGLQVSKFVHPRVLSGRLEPPLEGGEGGSKHADGGDEDTEPARALELWLVFRDEGVSLRSLVFAASSDPTSGLSTVLPGGLWHRLSTSPRPAAAKLMLATVTQLLVAVQAVHDAGVVHRDIKPGNVFLQSLDPEHEAQLEITPPEQRGVLDTAHSISGMQLRLGDFGSAVDLGLPPLTLFAPPGAGEWDLTIAYAPPEVLAGDVYTAASDAVLACMERLSTEDGSGSSADAQRCAPSVHWHWPVWGATPTWKPAAYDAWSVGVTVLETVLAQQPGADMFQLPSRWASVLQLQLQAAQPRLQQAFSRLQEFPAAAELLQSILAEHSWRAGKAALLSSWVHACLVTIDAIQRRVQHCRAEDSHSPANTAVRLAEILNSTSSLDSAEGALRALEAILRGAAECATLRAVHTALTTAGAVQCAGLPVDDHKQPHAGDFIKQLRKAHWGQACRFHTQRSAQRHRHREEGAGAKRSRQELLTECNRVPLAELQRPLGSLGAMGEAALVELLQHNASRRADAVSFVAATLGAEIRKWDKTG